MGYDSLPEWVQRELEELRKAPVGVVVLLCFGAALGGWVVSKLYSERFAVMEERLKSAQTPPVGAPVVASNTQGQNIYVSWGGSTFENCLATINGAALQQFSQDYRMVLVCGINRFDTDRLTDEAISISKAFTFTLQPSVLAIQMPVTPAMRALAKQLGKGAKMPEGPRPTGWKLTIELWLWYELVLLPKSIDPAVIHSLADVERFGGRLLPGATAGIVTSVPVE